MLDGVYARQYVNGGDGIDVSDVQNHILSSAQVTR